MPRIKRRGDIWYAWIPRPGGGTRLVSTNCTAKRAAELRAGELEREALDPRRHATQTTPLRRALELLILNRSSQAKAGARSQETVKFYQKKAGVILSTLGEARLAEITAGKIDTYVQRRRDDGAKDSTIAKELTTLRGALRLAKRQGWYSGDLSEVFDAGVSSESETRHRWLTFDEVLRLRSALRPELFAVVSFAVATGAEWSAVWRARRDDIAPDATSAKVRGSKNELRHRDVPIEFLAFGYLLDFARTHGDGYTLLFVDRSANFRRELTAACKRADIPHVCFTDLRRTHSTWLRLAGVSLETLAPTMGHADTRMVERRYGRLTAAEMAPRQRSELVRLMSGAPVDSSRFGAPTEKQHSTNQPENTVARDGIEPPTRGFSIAKALAELSKDKPFLRRAVRLMYAADVAEMTANLYELLLASSLR